MPRIISKHGALPGNLVWRIEQEAVFDVCRRLVEAGYHYYTPWTRSFDTLARLAWRARFRPAQSRQTKRSIIGGNARPWIVGRDAGWQDAQAPWKPAVLTDSGGRVRRFQHVHNAEDAAWDVARKCLHPYQSGSRPDVLYFFSTEDKYALVLTRADWATGQVVEGRANDAQNHS